MIQKLMSQKYCLNGESARTFSHPYRQEGYGPVSASLAVSSLGTSSSEPLCTDIMPLLCRPFKCTP